MPYALFSNDAQLSKAYPTEADVWKHARKSGLVVDVASDEDRPTPRPVLDNDYEIKPCSPSPEEDPHRNQAEAERQEQTEFQIGSYGGLSLWAAPPGQQLSRQSPKMSASGQPYGIAVASDACSAASATQAFLRCRPLIAPVTLSTLPAGHATSCTKAIS